MVVCEQGRSGPESNGSSTTAESERGQGGLTEAKQDQGDLEVSTVAVLAMAGDSRHSRSQQADGGLEQNEAGPRWRFIISSVIRLGGAGRNGVAVQLLLCCL